MIKMLFLKTEFICILCFLSMPMNAQHVEYDKVDSITIEKILNNADVNRMNVVEFAKFFIGKPYRASTLEEGDREHLIVNTRQFDCLTFIEIVSSLYLCSLNHEHTFEDYCKRLLSLRYRDGVIEDYTSRLHYFTWWACDNEKRGNIFVIDKPSSMFSETRIIDNTFMSSNPSKYKHLINSKDFLNKIRCYESELNGGSFSYIPKRMLNNQNLLGFIKSGDIIAIVTSKKGLDIAHVGFAIWINEKFHLLHAYSLKKKVVLDTKTLFDYSLENRSNLGIRVFGLCE